MPFVQRRNGVVCGTFAVFQPGIAEEFLPENDREVQAFWNPPETPIKAIVRLERENPITHRGQREFYLGFGEAFPQFKETHLYKEAKRVDDAIRAERAKL